MNAEVDALVAKWREEADALELIGYMWPANRLRQCADELAALAARPAAPVGEAERLLSRGAKVVADTLFDEALRADGVPGWRRVLMVAAVRRFGTPDIHPLRQTDN